MDDMRSLIPMVCDAIEEVTQEKSLSPSSVDYLWKLIDIKKNIYKVDMYENSGFSRDGGYDGGSSQRSRYMDGRFAPRGYSRDGYSRDGYSRDGYGGDYSRGDDAQKHRKQLERMMDEASSDREREALKRVLDTI